MSAPANAMRRDPAQLADTQFDVVVVGGGICAVSVARDAALRGLSVAILEARDWGHATSAHSLKIAHGGIRYLQHADFARVRESCRERSIFLRTAPHLVRPLDFVIPAYGHGRAGKEMLAAAFAVLAVVTPDRNRGISDPGNRIPRGRTISRAECLARFPAVDPAGLTGAGIFQDGQFYNPPRLVLAVLRSAVEAGAVALNYCAATGWLREGKRVTGVRATDGLSGRELIVRGRVVVNAAGPYAEALLVKSGVRPRRGIPLSRDLAIVTPRRLVQGGALAVQTRYRDPDAVFTRGNRHLFVVPWRDYNLVGVHSKVYEGEPRFAHASADEVQVFLDEINEANPRFALRLSDVSNVLWGLLPFGANDPDAKDLSFGKRSLLIDHAATDGAYGLLSAISVRFTTGRSIAERAVDAVFAKLGRQAPRCTTETAPVHGGDFESLAGLQRDIDAQFGSLPARVRERLARSYGAAWREVARRLSEQPHGARLLEESDVLEAEVVQAARAEMAVTLGDVVLRRTDLGTGAYPGEPALRQAAACMGRELQWTPARVEEEIAAVRATYPSWARSEASAVATPRQPK